MVPKTAKGGRPTYCPERQRLPSAAPRNPRSLLDWAARTGPSPDGRCDIRSFEQPLTGALPDARLNGVPPRPNRSSKPQKNFGE